MNSEMRSVDAVLCGGVTDEVVYVAPANVEESTLVLKQGMILLFQIEQDNFGVHGRKVTSFEFHFFDIFKLVFIPSIH